MGLLTVLKSKFSPQAAPAGGAGDDVERARTRARQRLIGAVVLVGAGIIGFPLLFETHPRPIPVDIPIEIANKDKVGALPMPAARAASARAAAASQAADATMITESASDAGRELPPAAVVAPEAPVRPPAETRKAEKPAEKTEKPVVTAAAKPAASAAQAKPANPPAVPPADAARARALLDGKDDNKPVAKADEPAASSARFVVQVGAFAEATAARETRQKVEKLGLKTYTQVVDTSSGSRIRVRVGPFVSREEADRAAGKLKSAGLSAALLTL